LAGIKEKGSKIKISTVAIVLISIGCCAVSAENSSLSPYAEKAIRQAEKRLLKVRHTYELEAQRTIERSIEALEKAIKTATKNGDFESAVAITILLEDLRGGAFLANFEEKYLSETLHLDENSRVISPIKLKEIVIDGRKKTGFDAGKVNRGQHVVFQYISGEWKGWGGIASESPDAEAQERGDRCRVAIVIDDEVVSIVPPRTISKPYVYEVKNSGHLTFRINDDDDDWISNLQGFVVYRFGIR